MAGLIPMSGPAADGTWNDWKFRPESDRHYFIHVSGGRSSGYMLRMVLDDLGGSLPDNVKAVFTNTGKEREETLDFLSEIQRRWNVDITWLEYNYRFDKAGFKRGQLKNWFKVVDHETASRDGTPFLELITSRNMLPNIKRRLCTHELKVRTVDRYSRFVLGWRDPVNLLGIRHDEPKRWSKALWTKCKTDWPLVYRNVSESDVNEFWAQQDFDLKMPSRWGNCDMCFLKGKRKLMALMSEDPEPAQWWIEQEEYRAVTNRTSKKRSNLQFRDDYSYRELMTLKDDEQMLPGLDDDVECFCGD